MTATAWVGPWPTSKRRPGVRDGMPTMTFGALWPTAARGAFCTTPVGPSRLLVRSASNADVLSGAEAHDASRGYPGRKDVVVSSLLQSTPVWFCGVGAVTGYGWGAKLLWDGMADGVSAVRLTPGFRSHFETDEGYIAQIEEG